MTTIYYSYKSGRVIKDAYYNSTLDYFVRMWAQARETPALIYSLNETLSAIYCEDSDSNKFVELFPILKDLSKKEIVRIKLVAEDNK